jgi:PKD repeat protein
MNILYSFLLVTILWSCSKSADNTPVRKPSVSFSYDYVSYSGSPGAIKFFNSSVNATTYAWDFGDGQSSTEKEPVNVYKKRGKYKVTLTAKGPGGENNYFYEISVDNLPA